CCEFPCVFARATQPAKFAVARLSMTLGDVAPVSRKPPEMATWFAGQVAVAVTSAFASMTVDVPVAVITEDPFRPSAPAGPCGPIGPVAPVAPAGPVSPVWPAGP